MKATAISGVLLLAMAQPALAFRCPSLTGKIDAALAEATNLTPAEVEEIEALRDAGSASHESGNHGLSIAWMKAALTKLGISDGSSSEGDGY